MSGGTATCVAGLCERTCTAPATTLCGDECVDVLTDESHCGACNYPVLGARTCVAGQPTPGWLAMPTGGGPTNTRADRQVVAWTGRRLLSVSPTEHVAYDPETNAWSPVDPPPAEIAASQRSYAGMSGRRQVLIWAASSGVSALIFDDAGSTPVWRTVTMSGAPTFLYPAFAYDATSDRVFASAGETVGRYDLLTATWTVGSSSGGCAAYPLAFANGRIARSGGTQPSSAPCSVSGSYNPTSLTFAPATPDPGLGQRRAGSFVSTGTQVFVYGGWRNCADPPTACDDENAHLWDPLGAAPTVARPFGPTDPGRSYAFVAFTGRALFIWGGQYTTRDNFSIANLNDGALGLVSGTTITWRPLPSTGAPSARSAAADEGFDGQSLWTGREMLVWGGWTGSSPGSPAPGGARYQPPVGCVCPRNADAPAGIASPCDSVTNIADTTCAPR